MAMIGEPTLSFDFASPSGTPPPFGAHRAGVATENPGLSAACGGKMEDEETAGVGCREQWVQACRLQLQHPID
jgi:hypothetical protein